MEIKVKNLPGTVLLVDDEPAIVRANTRLFKSIGWTVVPCTTVQQALEMLTLHKVDVVLSDYNMPNGGGEAVKKAAGETPVVFLTASVEDIEHRYIVHKPAMWEDVIGVVELAVYQREERMSHVPVASG